MERSATIVDARTGEGAIGNALRWITGGRPPAEAIEFVFGLFLISGMGFAYLGLPLVGWPAFLLRVALLWVISSLVGEIDPVLGVLVMLLLWVTLPLLSAFAHRGTSFLASTERRSLMRRMVPIPLLLFVIIITIACNGDVGSPPTGTPREATPTPEATAGTTGPAGRTGIAEVDAVIGFLLLHDTKAMQQTVQRFVGFTEVPCSTEGQVISGLPLCELNEEEGELVEVFEYGACEGQSLRPHEIDRILEILAQSSLYAVYRAPPDHPFAEEYVAVIVDEAPERRGLAWEVEIEGGRIVGLHFSCAAPPEELVELRGLEDAVLPPAGQ